MKEALGFLMTREVAHQVSFEKALYAITPNFPPGKLPGDPRFTSVYFNMSQGDGDMRGSWNSDENFTYVSSRDEQGGIDGGGEATTTLDADEAQAVDAMSQRTMSAPDENPQTGAELGAGVTPAGS